MIINKNKLFSPIYIWFISLIIVYTPWAEIRGVEFVDLENYLNKIEYLSRTNSEVLYNNEFIWGYIISIISKFENHIFVFSVLSFLSCVFVCWYTYRNLNYKPLALFLINPLMVDFFVSQTRSAVAISICLIGLRFSNPLKYLIVITSIGIHTSMSLLLLMVLTFDFLSYSKNKFGLKNLDLYNYTFCLFSPIVIALLYTAILSFIGDRRAEFSGSETVTFKFILFWVFSLAFFLFYFIQTRTDDFNSFLLIYFLSLFIGFSIFNIYSLRFLTYSIPFVILGIDHIKTGRAIYINLLFLYFTILWLFWLRLI